MDAHGVDVVVLCGENNVTYATGHATPSQELKPVLLKRRLKQSSMEPEAFWTARPLMKKRN